jgi:hypothetical protein
VESEATYAVSRGYAVDRDYRMTAIAFIGSVRELVQFWTATNQPMPIERMTAELTRLALALLTAP